MYNRAIEQVNVEVLKSALLEHIKSYNDSTNPQPKNILQSFASVFAGHGTAGRERAEKLRQSIENSTDILDILRILQAERKKAESSDLIFDLLKTTISKLNLQNEANQEHIARKTIVIVPQAAIVTPDKEAWRVAYKTVLDNVISANTPQDQNCIELKSFKK